MGKKIAEARREIEVWEVINRERRKRKRGNMDIEMGEWKEQFMELLGGVEERAVKGGEGQERVGKEEDISREEIKRVLRKMKDGKAAEIDKIPGEVWRYGGEELEK